MSESKISPVSFFCIVCRDNVQFAPEAVCWYKIVDDRRVLPMKAAHVGCLSIELGQVVEGNNVSLEMLRVVLGAKPESKPSNQIQSEDRGAAELETLRFDLLEID